MNYFSETLKNTYEYVKKCHKKLVLLKNDKGGLLNLLPSPF